MAAITHSPRTEDCFRLLKLVNQLREAEAQELQLLLISLGTADRADCLAIYKKSEKTREKVSSMVHYLENKLALECQTCDAGRFIQMIENDANKDDILNKIAGAICLPSFGCPLNSHAQVERGLLQRNEAIPMRNKAIPPP